MTVSSPPTHTFRVADTTDAKQISHLIGTTWAHHFGHSVTPSDLAAYLSGPVSVEGILRDMDNPQCRFIVACTSTCTSSAAEAEPSDSIDIIGVAQLVFDSTDPSLPSRPVAKQSGGVRTVEIQRIYVHSSAHGTGLGTALLSRAEQEAGAAAGGGKDGEDRETLLWLGVWEHNHRAQRFYAREGYEKTGEHAFMVGESVRRDWIVVKRIGSEMGERGCEGLLVED